MHCIPFAHACFVGRMAVATAGDLAAYAGRSITVLGDGFGVAVPERSF